MQKLTQATHITHYIANMIGILYETGRELIIESSLRTRNKNEKSTKSSTLTHLFFTKRFRDGIARLNPIRYRRFVVSNSYFFSFPYENKLYNGRH